MNLSLPPSIQALVSGRAYTLDTTGLSGSQVLIYEDIVLKIEPTDPENRKTATLMGWLQGKLPVPEVLCFETQKGFDYTLMTRIPGKMACDRSYLEQPERLLSLLGNTLKGLWTVDITHCPRRQDPDTLLKLARHRVENSLVDVEDVEPETFGPGGFRDPMELLLWLEHNKPGFDPVFCHGDFCLPNVFFKDNALSGLIDLGHAGVGDRYLDIALCYRSLRHNFDGSYGGKVYPDFQPDRLFDHLGITPDWDKIRYYLLLDELF